MISAIEIQARFGLHCLCLLTYMYIKGNVWTFGEPNKVVIGGGGGEGLWEKNKNEITVFQIHVNLH